MANRVATIKGTFLVPTVSKNRRLYTKENIGKAVKRMNNRIGANETLPLTMFPSHRKADEDNALDTIGRITKVKQEADGSATFEADIADTTAGRNMAVLVDPKNPFVKGISIRGAWVGTPETVEADDGGQAVTADDIAIDGIDWTHRPGVEGAEITDAKFYEAAAFANQANFIFESADAEAVFFDETEPEETDNRLSEAADMLRAAADTLTEAGNAPGDGSKPYGNTTYADPGYQKDKKKRYPIDTAAHVRAAWAYINKGKNAGAYSSAQLARIKGRIKSAAKKFKIDINEEVDNLTEDFQAIIEAYATMSVSHGGHRVEASGYTADPDPGSTPSATDYHDLARRVAFAAISGIHAAHADDDDIDLDAPAAEAVVSPDDNMEDKECAECGESALPGNMMYCPMCGASLGNESYEEEVDMTEASTESEAQVAETQTTEPQATESTETPVVAETTAAPPTVSLTKEDLATLIGSAVTAAVQAVKAAPAEPVEEVPQPITVTPEELAAMKQQMKEEADNEALEAVRKSGLIPQRAGFASPPTVGQFSQPVTASEATPKTAKEFAEMSTEEYYGNTYEALASHPGWASVMARADERARMSRGL